MKQILMLSLVFLLVACAAPQVQPQTQTTIVVSGATAQKVLISNFHFTPQVINVAVGDTVTWTNDDSTSHIVSVDGVESPELFKGDSWSHTFDAKGSFDYLCTIHTSMKGTVNVG